MPCYRCGARQVDPVRGESPWRRGVRGERQVLVCPDCQASFDWMAELDRCPVCASAHLVRRLGEVECRDCGDIRQSRGPGAAGAPGGRLPEAGGPAAVVAAEAGGGAGVEPGRPVLPGLAQEVELALDRVLGRARKPARIG